MNFELTEAASHVMLSVKHGREALAAFEIGAVNKRGLVVNVATVGKAKLAVVKFLEAREQYERAWISDEAGHVLTFHELTRRAQEEEPNA